MAATPVNPHTVAIESVVDFFQLKSVTGNHAHVEKSLRDNDDKAVVDLLDSIHAQLLHFPRFPGCRFSHRVSMLGFKLQALPPTPRHPDRGTSDPGTHQVAFRRDQRLPGIVSLGHLLAEFTPLHKEGNTSRDDGADDHLYQDAAGNLLDLVYRQHPSGKLPVHLIRHIHSSIS
ncbi:hypothetical protein [Rhodanobacter ginsengiterrae]|uniref:hypothetical protein n=1 Tax=Rhodanobacter ginsengiterrae TaxID=2008451 RepID=UPI003CF6B330